MAFSIQFGKTNDAPNVMYKNVTNVGAVKNCSPWQQVSMLTGTVILDHAENIEGCNYAHITGDGRARYCYIKDISYDIGNNMTVTLEVDPLMTYQDKIEKLDIEVTRCYKQAIEGSESGYNSMLHDEQIETSCQRTYREFPFYYADPAQYHDPSGRMILNYPGGEYILAVIG